MLMLTTTTFAGLGSAKVLVVGASGGTGSRALRGLLDVGYKPNQLRVLTRNPMKPSLSPLRANWCRAVCR